MLKATILALVVAHAAAYNAAPLVGRGAVRAAASRRPALAVMHHGVGDHPEPAAYQIGLPSLKPICASMSHPECSCRS